MLLSPIPFIGLGVAMSTMESIKKNNKSGFILSLLALLINMGVILFILYAIFQIFTLNPVQLTGFSKYMNDVFSLV